MTRIKKTNRNRRRDDNRSNRFKEDKNVINKFEKPVREKREYKETRRTYEKPARENIERNNAVESVREDLIIGRNAVMEALKSDKTIEALYVTKGQREGSINAILSLAKENRVVIKEVDKKKLDSMSNGEVHQGAIAVITPYKYFEIKDILDAAKEKGESPFIVILDELEDPHNLGAILRTCDAVGVDGVIIGKNRSVGLNGTVAKVSTGAIHHVKVAQVTNLTRTLEDLKKKAFWVVGCELENSQDYRSVDYNMPTVLVIGSEGFGMSRLVKKSCDINVVLPMVGHVNSLNASVAASVLLYQVYNSRHPL